MQVALLESRARMERTALDLNFETAHDLFQRLFIGYEKVYLLQGSGFNMTNQIDQWIRDFDPNDQESKKILIEKTMSDVRGFYHEFLSRRDIFPFELEIRKNETGERYVYSTKYDQPLENITQANEREGALLEGVKIATEMIINSEPNTIIILNSPEGWTGLPTGAHPDNQTHVYWVGLDGDLKALTLRSDIDIVASEKLVGLDGVNLSLINRIKNVVRNPISVAVVNDGFIEALDLIEKASGHELNKLRHEIQNRDTYIELTGEEDLEIKQVLSDLELFLNEEINDRSEQTIKKLAFNIGKSILDMQNAVNKREAKYNNQTMVVGYDSSEIKYQVLSQQVKEILGCSNGIREQRSFDFDRFGSLDFNCPSCNRKNTRPLGQLISNCQHCGADVRC